ncbi:MAG: acyl-CoA dehydrogenase family protein [Anaerolineae bacterium]
MGAATLGGAQSALQQSLEWAAMRTQFGKPLAHAQTIQFMVADMAAEVEALRSLVYRTAWLVDNNRPFIKEAGMCKLLGSEIARRAASIALRRFTVRWATAVIPLSSAVSAIRASPRSSKAPMKFSAS